MKKLISCLVIAVFVVCVIGINYDMVQPTAQSTAPKSSVMITVDYPVYPTAQELVDSADLVFHGVVTGYEYKILEDDFDEDDVYTLYTIDVSHVYKGNIDDNTITIKFPGGIYGDTRYSVSGYSFEHSVGNDYLFLTKTYKNTYPSLVNLEQGVYDMNDPQTVSDIADITLAEILDILDKVSE